MLKRLFQEILDFKKYGNCLSTKLYRCYKHYLQEQVLEEYTTKQLYQIYTNLNQEKTPISQRINKTKNQFKNTRISFKRNETGELIKDSTNMIHLQLENRKDCTKKEFEKEFLKYDFNNQKDAEGYLKAITDLFEEDGWLKSTFSQDRIS